MPRLRPCCQGTRPQAPLSLRRWRRLTRRRELSPRSKRPAGRRPDLRAFASTSNARRGPRILHREHDIDHGGLAAGSGVDAEKRKTKSGTRADPGGSRTRSEDCMIGACRSDGSRRCRRRQRGPVCGPPARPRREVFEQVTGQHPVVSTRAEKRSREQRSSARRPLRRRVRRPEEQRQAALEQLAAGAARGRARQCRGGEPHWRRARRRGAGP